MSLRVLTIQEMLNLPYGSKVVLVNNVATPYHEIGTTMTRGHHQAWSDDGESVSFSLGGADDGYDYFEEGQVAVTEAEDKTFDLSVFAPQDSKPLEEVGNPKVGAASKKYSLRYLPLAANVEVNRALENGADKYGLCNWRNTNVKASVYIDAALRHIAQWQEGQELASDSTVHNLGHAMASLAIIIDAQAQGVIIDDRPTASKDTDFLLLRP